jgi:hypothetical protein
MTLWSLGAAGILRVQNPTSERLTEVIRAARSDLNAYGAVRGMNDAIMFSGRTFWNQFPSVASIAEQNGVWLLMPIVFRDGSETYRVLSTERMRIRRFLSALGRTSKVEVLSHRTRSRLDPTGDLGVLVVDPLEGVTDRQRRLLARAVEEGLLEIPARRTLDDIAPRVGLARSTLGEHLRKAQAKILRNIYPLIMTQSASEQ